MSIPAFTTYPDLRGKTVLITGSGRGIGKSLAEAFIHNGARAILLYKRNKPEPSETLPDQEAPVFLGSDVRDIDTVSNWLSSFEADGNTVDILINNAGIYESKPLLDCKDSDWDETMDINLRAPFKLAQRFARHMIDHQVHGSIINALSFAAKSPSANRGLYAASKAALAMLTRSMAAEWAPHQIRVNAYSPGVIETDMTRPVIEENEQAVLESISMNRFGHTREAANAVLFLASEASSYLTGVDLDISGGKFAIQNPGKPWDEHGETNDR